MIYELADVSEELTDDGDHEDDRVVDYTQELIKRIKSELDDYWKF
jgi:secreted Zn-dependent insulinase-like peptidase